MPDKGVLVLGGSRAGLRAALDLAQSGIPVYWVERTPFLGQKEGGQARHQLTAEMLEAAKHPHITLLTDARVTGLSGQRGDFQVEVQHGPRYVDPARCTACRDCEPACPVTILVNGQPRKAIFGPPLGFDALSTVQAPDGAQPTLAGYRAVPNVFVIEKRGMAPCQAACPGGIHVQGYVALIAQGRFQEALKLIYEAVPFPRVLGRVCHHPCEEKCRRGTEVDEPVAICALKRFVADLDVGQEAILSSAPPVPAGRVAIVGAGPAGLTAAFFLARQGILSEVFEALPVAGGMMAVGIPAYRLPPEVLQQEIAAIEALGVTIHLNHPVDRAEWQRLREQYDAVFVAVGAHRGQALGIPGEDLPGVFSGVDFLRTVNLAARGVSAASPPSLGAKVVVVGGGNVAIDSARVARRMGGQAVTVLYRRTRAEMPAEPWQIQEAEEEGIHFHYLAAPVRALGRDGVLTALECIRMELGEPDASGRRRPVPVAGSEFILECDTLLVAIGQKVEAPFEGLSRTQGGTYVADPVTMQTDVPGVFAGGDAVSGPASVIEAIAAGRRAAESILRYLRGEDLATGRAPQRPDLPDTGYYTPEQPVPRPRTQMPRLPLTQRSGFAEVNLGLTPEQAMAEAERCLSCGVCSECLACVAACQPGAIDHNAVGERLTLDIGAVIVADPAQYDREEREGIYTVETDDILGASVAAAQAMADLARFRQRVPVPGELVWPTAIPRVGVFICRCGDQIGGVVDVEALVDSAKGLPGVLYAWDLSFACHMEAAEVIRQAVVNHRLNRVVLAACSCCSLDQVCYSCTTQRIRCKTNLGVLAAHSARLREIYADMSPWFEFVNIREHCAWLHADDSATATAEARRLVAAAVASVNLLPPPTRPIIQLGSRVLVAGDGAAGEVCAAALKAQGFAVVHSKAIPLTVVGSPGRFTATWDRDGQRHPVEADAVVLAPSEGEQWGGLRNAVGITGPTNLPTARLSGVFLCPPDSPTEVGAAVAARVAALLGGGQMVAGWNVARVDPQRCRACGTCVNICEFHAPRLVVDQASPHLQSSTALLVSQIDPALCRGCGTCAARCPSGAITVGYSTDEQIEAMLAALLA